MILDPTRRRLLSGMALGFVPASAVAARRAQAQPASNLHDVGLFSSASMRAAAGASVVQTSGYSVIGEGAARYIHDEAVDAAYVAAHPRLSFRAADGRGFRLDPQQRLTIQMFGGRADGTSSLTHGVIDGAYGATDNAPALQAAMVFVSSAEVVSGADNYYRAGPAIHFPASEGVYDFNASVDIKSTVQLIGDSGSGISGATSSNLRWRPGMHGLVVHAADTAGSGTTASATWSGGGTVIEGVGIFQHQTGNDSAGEFHGVWFRNRATIRNFSIIGWSGNGINIVCGIGAGGALEGNANNFRIENGLVYQCEHGIYIDGGDANAGHIQGVDASANRGYGIFDSSFLGNTIIACHTSDNGSWHRNGNLRTATVYHAGYEWYVHHGASVAASTTEPGSLGAEAVWRRGTATRGPSIVHPQWVSGMSIRDGGGYCIDGSAAQTVAIGCYSEGGQGGNFVAGGSIVLGGAHYYGWYGGGTYMSGGGGIGSFTTPIEWLRTSHLGEIGAKVRLGGDHDGLNEILHIEDATRVGKIGTEYLRLSWAGVQGQSNWKDLVFTKGNPALNRHAFRITTPQTDETFGRSTRQPLTFAAAELAIGSRIHQSGPGAPTAGYHAKGEVCWNDHTDPASDAVDYWICKTAGEGAAAAWIARP